MCLLLPEQLARGREGHPSLSHLRACLKSPSQPWAQPGVPACHCHLCHVRPAPIHPFRYLPPCRGNRRKYLHCGRGRQKPCQCHKERWYQQDSLRESGDGDLLMEERKVWGPSPAGVDHGCERSTLFLACWVSLRAGIRQLYNKECTKSNTHHHSSNLSVDMYSSFMCECPLVITWRYSPIPPSH